FGAEAVGDFLVALDARALEHQLLVPVEAQPGEAVEDHLRVLVGGASLVGVLDAQQELAALVAGVQPVEQGGAGASDVEVAGGGGGESDANGHVNAVGVRYGEGGIRTPDRGISPYNGLANRRLQPLGHLSSACTAGSLLARPHRHKRAPLQQSCARAQLAGDSSAICRA